jgi:hypothetical protein
MSVASPVDALRFRPIASRRRTIARQVYSDAPFRIDRPVSARAGAAFRIRAERPGKQPQASKAEWVGCSGRLF